MARIRSIKPEFWSSPGIETVDPYARLLFIAMWNWADDSGVGVANPRELLGFAFPLDEEITVADLRRMLVEIRRVFGVKFYTVAGRPYYYIPSWEKHQKFDRRSKGKYPGPDEAEDEEIPANKGNSGHSTESHESTSSARRDSVAGTGEQRNRGTGEQGKKKPAPPTADAPENGPAQQATKDAYERVGKAFKYVAVLAIAKWAVKERGVGPERLADALVAIYNAGKPITKQVLGQYLDGKLNPHQQRLDHSARGLAKGMAMLQAYDAQQTHAFELEA